MLNVLERLKYRLDRKTLESIYFVSFVRAKLEYSSSGWSNLSKNNIEKLEDCQLRAVRTISDAKKGTKHKLIYEELSLPTLDERKHRNNLIKMHTIIHKKNHLIYMNYCLIPLMPRWLIT